MNALLQAILAKLDRGDAPDSKWPDGKGEFWSLCPFHTDLCASNFSVSEKGYHCFACGASGGLQELAEHLGVGVAPLHRCTGGTAHIHITLEQYATAKRLPIQFLEGLGVFEQTYRGQTRLVLPYLNEAGEEVGRRYRLTMAGRDRFRWARGARVVPYGLWRLSGFRSKGYVMLTEGESDAQTLWLHNVPALGVPGASTWKQEWAQYLSGLVAYIWKEPDVGGQTFAQRVGESLPEARVITAPQGRKDISECYVLGDDVPALAKRLMAEAKPYQELRAEALSKEARKVGEQASELVECPDILGRFTQLCRSMGLVGEERISKLLYLAITSRLLEEPVSLILKGPSAGGKSFTVDVVLKAFPDSAYYALSSMSERALAYSEEPLSHRVLVVFEAAGLASDFGSYLLRTLLSEHRIRYETVEKTRDGLVPKLIEREGPTGCLLTTTWATMHPENETRMFSLTVRDDAPQTLGVFQALAERADGSGPEEPDVTPWHALQRWLELAGRRKVAIPYAHELAANTNPKAVRMRRDFGKVLTLIQTHALLHQANRERDSQGRVVATVDDYRAVHDLVADILSEGVEATVNSTVRETVEAVGQLLLAHGGESVGLGGLADHLGLDKSAVSRRVRVAKHLGYLVDLETRRGMPCRLVLGEALPAETPVLPDPEVVRPLKKAYDARAKCNQGSQGSMCVCSTPPATLQQCNSPCPGLLAARLRAAGRGRR